MAGGFIINGMWNKCLHCLLIDVFGDVDDPGFVLTIDV